MINDEYEQEEISQCVYCESVYFIKESDSTFKYACCSSDCELKYMRFINNLEFV